MYIHTTMGNKMSAHSAEEVDERDKYRSFPGSSVLEKTFCGSIDTTDPSEYQDQGTLGRLLKRAEVLCISSPVSSEGGHGAHRGFADDLDSDNDEEDINSVVTGSSPSKQCLPNRKTGKLLARALVSEVTDNPNTMKAASMQEREYKLLKAQQMAQQAGGGEHYSGGSANRAVGREPSPHVLRSISMACTGEDDTMMPEMCQAAEPDADDLMNEPASPFQVTIGLCLSRRSAVGHPGTVTRQTAFDLNELQDREYKYVSATSGWKAGGGEAAGSSNNNYGENNHSAAGGAPDTVHLPIIHIDCPNQPTVDAVIGALASGEIFIPHMTVLPEALSSVSTVSPPSVTLRFGCERDEDAPPEEWPNWGLEFMHNQLYEYFYAAGARWMRRPFQLVLAESVRWKTVKHMNRYFANGEKVVAAWRDRGPQSLDPIATHLEGGASQEEVARPHGIYLFQKGVPTNYFGPNFEPPYTTKMTRSLLLNVLSKSWNKKHREWSSVPVPNVVTPTALMAAAMGCSKNGGFVAREATDPHFTPQTPSQARTPNTKASMNSEAAFIVAPASPAEHSFIEFPSESFSPSKTTEQSRQSPAALAQATSKSSDVTTGVSSQKENMAEEKKEEASPPSRSRYATAEEDLEKFTKKKGFRLSGGGGGGASTAVHENHHHHSSASVTHSSVNNHSVAGTETTVMHANKRTPSSIKRSNARSPIHRGKLFSDEDFMDEFNFTDPPGSTPPKKVEHRRPSEQPVAQPQQQVSQIGSGSPSKILSQRNNGSNAASPTKLSTQGNKLLRGNYTMHVGSPRNSNSTGKNDFKHAVSLDYSTDDGSSFFFRQEDTSLIGQQFAPNNSSEQSSSPVLQHQPKPSSVKEVASEDDSLLSIQESTSSMQSVVPTDEELYSVGWAKALDPNSGNYYYFTLDRSKTVWDNPLSQSQWGGELPPPVQGVQQQQQQSRSPIKSAVDP